MPLILCGWCRETMPRCEQMPKTPPLPPGTPTPRSGIYEQVGPRGGRTGEQADFDARQAAASDGRPRSRLGAYPTRPPQGEEVKTGWPAVPGPFLAK